MVVATNYALRYAITDLGGPGALSQLDKPAARAAHLRALVRRWAVDGVDILQLREKQLESGEVYQLAAIASSELRAGTPTVHSPASASTGTDRRRPLLLIHGRADIAAAVQADGVHLSGAPGELHPAQVRRVFIAASLPECLVSVSCHSIADVELARERGAGLVLFGPVFEKLLPGKRHLPGTGLEQLRLACAAAGDTPVLALGGVTRGNQESCIAAGAAGIAAIRLFR